jgi:hypothetical protein
MSVKATCWYPVLNKSADTNKSTNKVGDCPGSRANARERFNAISLCLG